MTQVAHRPQVVTTTNATRGSLQPSARWPSRRPARGTTAVCVGVITHPSNHTVIVCDQPAQGNDTTRCQTNHHHDDKSCDGLQVSVCQPVACRRNIQRGGVGECLLQQQVDALRPSLARQASWSIGYLEDEVTGIIDALTRSDKTGSRGTGALLQMWDGGRASHTTVGTCCWCWCTRLHAHAHTYHAHPPSFCACCRVTVVFYLAAFQLVVTTCVSPASQPPLHRARGTVNPILQAGVRRRYHSRKPIAEPLPTAAQRRLACTSASCHSASTPPRPALPPLGLASGRWLWTRRPSLPNAPMSTLLRRTSPQNKRYDCLLLRHAFVCSPKWCHHVPSVTGVLTELQTATAKMAVHAQRRTMAHAAIVEEPTELAQLREAFLPRLRSQAAAAFADTTGAALQDAPGVLRHGRNMCMCHCCVVTELMSCIQYNHVLRWPCISASTTVQTGVRRGHNNCSKTRRRVPCRYECARCRVSVF